MRDAKIPRPREQGWRLGVASYRELRDDPEEMNDMRARQRRRARGSGHVRERRAPCGEKHAMREMSFGGLGLRSENVE
jgi:hypothetical protein